MLAVALIGTTITPYIQLYEAGAVVDKGIGPEEYKYERVDAIGGAIAGRLRVDVHHRRHRRRHRRDRAAQLGRRGRQGPEPVAGAGGRDAVRPRPARRLGPGRRGGAAVDVLRGGRGGRGRSGRCRASFRQAPLFLGLFTAQILIGAAVVLVPGNLIHLIVNTQVLEGVITPITLVFILVLANRRALLGAAANGPLARWRGRRLRGRGRRPWPSVSSS